MMKQYISEIIWTLFFVIFLHTLYICYKKAFLKDKKVAKKIPNIYIDAHKTFDEKQTSSFGAVSNVEKPFSLDHFYITNYTYKKHQSIFIEDK
ncbi:hypothetical protein FMM05_17000 [Flavobacterium zepuense]|uniref:Uncharacterized protein n=1 Tax=Flavobacterium zepuense TaxID=2593302 RepID=A0A552UWI9_9FLAO|nr:hypothetical protein [Flavobacterium zepuense]TRW22578.1 hypothetical protein FMM05_17000 [Flavobacterium zepuense]